MSSNKSMWVVFLQKQRLLYCISFLFKLILTINKGQVDGKLRRGYLRWRLFRAIENLLMNYFSMILKKEVQMLS